MTSFQNKKALRFKITLATKTFGSSGENVIDVRGLRAKVEIEKSGGVMMSQAVCKIYGMTQSDMNAITTTLWSPDSFPRSSIEIYAIDGTAETLVFVGDIIVAMGDYQSLPDVFLLIQASTMAAAQRRAVDPTNVKGGIKVDILFQDIADKLGLKFINHQVNETIIDAYLDKDLISQAREIASAVNIDLVIDNGVMAIKYKTDSIPTIEPAINKETGLIGYPVFDGTGVVFRCLYNPAILFKGAVILESEIPKASGRWIVDSIGTYLESENPGGAWFNYVRGSYHGQSI